jgi:hypothetical protein
MKAIGLLLFTFSLNVYAQVTDVFTYNYEITCGPVIQIIEFISKTQKEELTWTGLDIADGSVYSLWQDKDGNWTLLKKGKKIACIIGYGTMAQNQKLYNIIERL